ncbi:DUF2752 domain-containing protein [Nocardioides insulae]|uniref:DUF2752 domain-containing protein n=1 Tax=Nocardioides insulae TaxID=394734 RepID=UPI000416392E|nr:DUF2752 domain-containing protein [Nocardioides insulae]
MSGVRTTDTVPAARSASRWRRVRAPFLVIGGLSAATAALHLRDPHQQGSWGFCPTSLIGLDCPGCGGLRAVNDLTNGQVVAAMSSNLVVTLAIPLVTIFLAVWFLDRWRGVAPRRPVSAKTWVRLQYAAVAVLFLFMAVRNLPGSWLAA